MAGDSVISPELSIAPPLFFAEGKQGIYGKRISRRCLRRKLAFLPDPWQAFMKNFIK
jgi:hypothetical protein